MKVKILYGKSGLGIDLKDSWDVTVVEPSYVPCVPDPHRALVRSLQHPIGCQPLRQQVSSTDRIAIIFNDITRPTPSRLIINSILDELPHNIILFNAVGTHRQNTTAELREILGDDLVDRYRIVQNNAVDPETQVCIGSSSRGNEIWLNRELMACDVKILTGFIEPHFFAGFSGGGKALMPGMAAMRTIMHNHDAHMIAHPQSTWGIREGNPIWDEVNEVLRRIDRTFLMNVAMNRDKEITGIFAGDPDAAHASGCDFVKKNAMVAVPHPFDIVISSNAGYPSDLNLYQAVKGMSAAAQIISPGGAIIVAAECWDGIPDHGSYKDLLCSVRTPKELLAKIMESEVVIRDQWQAQIQAQVQLKADVYVHSDHLTDEQIGCALLKPCHRIEETVEMLLERYGPDASICVLPEGPQTVPCVAGYGKY